MMMKIIVEVLDILGTATKVMKQSRAREFMHRLLSLKAHVRVEKFLRKVGGITELEDGLKKLDNMTNEEVRMAIAEVMRLAHDLNTKMEGVDKNVQGVDVNVKVVEEKVQTIIDGA